MKFNSGYRASVNTRGLTLVELLLSLAIGAMLLAATASAFYTGASTISANQGYFSASQRARVGCSNMISAVRSSLRTRLSADGKAIFVESNTAPGDWNAYVYDAANRELLFDTTPGPADQPVNLATVRSRTNVSVFRLMRDVNTFQCDAELGVRPITVPSADSPGTLVTETTVVNLHLRLNVGQGRDSFSVDESVIPRHTVPLELVNVH